MFVAVDDDSKMMHPHKQSEPHVTQFSLSPALLHWQAIHDRYCLLRQLSDAEALGGSSVSCNRNRALVLEDEIEDLECVLEDLTREVALSADLLPSHINAILTVLLADMKIRHQIDESDTAILLILSAQRTLTMVANEKALP